MVVMAVVMSCQPSLVKPSHVERRGVGGRERAEELEFQFDDDLEQLGGKRHNFSESPW